MRFTAVKAPASSLVTRRLVLVASLVTVTSTPAIAAPVLSVIFPMIDARSTCPRSVGVKTKESSKNEAANEMAFNMEKHLLLNRERHYIAMESVLEGLTSSCVER